MKIIQIPLADFDALYHILTQYLDMKISADECIEEGLQYITDKEILSTKPFIVVPIGEGYRLIHKYAPDYHAFRSIFLSLHEKKLFYEGITSIRFLDEMRYVDYMQFDREDIKMLCKKYNLKPNED